MSLAYILLTSGRRHFDPADLWDHPAARQQVTNIQAVAQQRWPDAQLDWGFDYARSIERLTDLPVLRQGLEQCRELGTGVIVMDDLLRLFGRVPQKERAAFWKELEPLGKHLAGLRQGGVLADLPTPAKRQLTLATGSGRYVVDPASPSTATEEERRAQTRRATRVSSRVRAQAADRRARQLMGLLDELVEQRGPLSHSALAEAANARGLVTTRGEPWTRQSIHRALKRLGGAPDRERLGPDGQWQAR